MACKRGSAPSSVLRPACMCCYGHFRNTVGSTRKGRSKPAKYDCHGLQAAACCPVVSCAAVRRGSKCSVEGGVTKVLTNFTSSTKSGVAAKSTNRLSGHLASQMKAGSQLRATGMECSGRYRESVRLGCDYSLARTTFHPVGRVGSATLPNLCVTRVSS